MQRRREFMAGLAAGSVALANSAHGQGKGPLVDHAGATGATLPKLCRVRPNINSLSEAQLNALKLGITTMMGRPANDPTSWSYQAAIHGSLMTPALPLWNECQHGSDQFLSWHRLFLFRFESILRKASGSAGLMLPFWDWTNNRQLPAPFRNNVAGNPLFTTHRNNAVNGGALLPASAVSFAAAFPQVPFANFSSSLEGTPHGAVHVSIGGWMGVVPQAAQDPIFWLHHANIDRLWSLWLGQGGGRADPNTSTWLNRKFSFFDENKVQVSMTPKQTLESCRDLGYLYEKVGPVLPFNPPVIAGASVTLVAQRRAAQADNTDSVALGPQQAEVQIPLSRARDQLRSAMRATGNRQYLTFDDIEVTDPEGYYEVYLNPPPGKPLEFTDPSYVGNLVLFGLGPDAGHHDAGAKPSRTLDITGKLARAGLGDIGPDSKLRVVLVLREPEGASTGKPPVARARVGHIQLMTDR